MSATPMNENTNDDVLSEGNASSLTIDLLLRHRSDLPPDFNCCLRRLIGLKRPRNADSSRARTTTAANKRGSISAGFRYHARTCSRKI